MWLVSKKKEDKLAKLETEGEHKRAEVEDAERNQMGLITRIVDAVPLADRLDEIGKRLTRRGRR